MTKDEAIKVFEKISSYDGIVDYLENYSVSVQDACFMAIKALKQYGVLQEIRDDLSEYNIYDHEQVFTDYYDAFNTGIHTALIIIDKHIKEIEK